MFVKNEMEKLIETFFLFSFCIFFPFSQRRFIAHRRRSTPSNLIDKVSRSFDLRYIIYVYIYYIYYYY